MTKNEKKALIKKAKAAGLTDEKLIAAFVGGMSIEEALKVQKANEELKHGGSSEQGQDVAGKESGEASGSSSEGAAQENKPADDSSKDSKPSSDDQKEKVWEVNCNVFHNGHEFKLGQAMHQDDKNFAELKELGFLN